MLKFSKVIIYTKSAINRMFSQSEYYSFGATLNTQSDNPTIRVQVLLRYSALKDFECFWVRTNV